MPIELPFYKLPFLTLFYADCMDIMRQYPDKYFDLAIVDPPYGIREDGHRENNRSKLAKSKKYHKALWDQPRPDENYFKELFRVSKNQIIWGANNYPEYLRQSPCWLVWNKNNSGNFADCELAYGSFETAVRMFTFTWNGMIQGDMKNKENRIHPTQKPVQLYRWILRNYAKPDQKILDTHFGSGSIALAVDKANRLDKMNLHLTACEIDEDYCKSAVKRISESIKQGTLSF